MAIDIKTYNDIPPQICEGYVFFIKDIQYNKTFHCGDSCYDYKTIMNSEYRRTCSNCINPNVKGSFTCTEVVIGVIATNNVVKEWYVNNPSSDLDIITTKGNTFSDVVLCSEVTDSRQRTNKYKPIHKRSKTQIIYTFPVLAEGEEIQSIILKNYFNGSKHLRFEILEVEVEDDEYDIGNYPQPKTAPASERQYVNSSQSQGGNLYNDSFTFKHLYERITVLKTEFFQRFNTRISPSEAEKLEDKIETEIYSLKLSFASKYHSDSEEWNSLREDFENEVANYREVLFQKQQSERREMVKLKRVSELLNINPYDFEILCSNIMKGQGYTNVVVTPRSNDKGIDIVAEKNGERIVAQCKRYRNSVGSPDMQMFIGAMHNANADGGVYFTTGTFTKEAEQMAASNHIALFDKTRLAKSLSIVDDIASSDTARVEQPSLWNDDNDLPE